MIHSEIIGAAGGWHKQSHPKMRKFDQYYSETKNAYLSVMKDGSWELFLPVEVSGIQCFSDKPTQTGKDADTLKAAL